MLISISTFVIEKTREVEEDGREKGIHSTTRGNGGASSHMQGRMQNNRAPR